TSNSATATVVVTPKAAPSFAQNLVIPSRTIYSNGAIKLSVAAVGGGGSYQWKKNGTDISGQTGSSPTISGVNGTNAGTYTVVASNSVSTATSASTTVAVATPSAGSYEAFVGADGPISWYRLDDPVSSPYMLDAMGRWDGFWTNRAGPNATLGVSGALSNDVN